MLDLLYILAMFQHEFGVYVFRFSDHRAFSAASLIPAIISTGRAFSRALLRSRISPKTFRGSEAFYESQVQMLHFSSVYYTSDVSVTECVNHCWLFLFLPARPLHVCICFLCRCFSYLGWQDQVCGNAEWSVCRYPLKPFSGICNSVVHISTL